MQPDQPIPRDLADAQVLDAEGAAHRLGDRIEAGQVLLVLLRQFGCVGCNLLVTRLGPRLLEIHELGLRSVFVGLGRPEHLAGFVERMHLFDKQVELYTDPTMATHRAAGLARSAWASLGPRSLWQRVQLLGEGIVSGPVQGDPFQLSGVALLEDGAARWVHASDSPAGHPPAEEIVDRAMRLAWRRRAAGRALT